jgi:hypothetical protein
VQSTSGHFLLAIITLFSALAFVPILVVIFGLIIRRRKESISKQRSKNEKHENEFRYDDGLQNYDQITNGNEVNSYEMINYELDNYGIGVYDEINENESKIEANTSKTVEYLQIFE